MNQDLKETADLLRALARAIYRARTAADLDSMQERLDSIEDDLQKAADHLQDLAFEVGETTTAGENGPSIL